MEALKYIEKFREYLDYLERHIKNVKKAFELVKIKCSDMNIIYDDYLYHKLERDVLLHDMSKFSTFEFVQYQKQFYPVDYNVKNIGAFALAWQHHIDFNSHHWENWTTDSKNWDVDCAHMVIDWIAMGFEFNDTAQEYYEKNRAEIKLPDYAVDFIYEIFKRIKELDDV